MAEKYSRFGKYLILDHLVDGGMAKICRASYLGEQANKIVAIKMVQPRYSKNPSFVQMFEDELKVTFGLLHPNIAQVYDYGMVDEQLYSAMEYVDGANLKQYLDRLKQMKFVFPVEISTHIISQVCQALHYAHTFTDKLTGKPFNIIHRDISPHNIMLTYDGSVKVIDFGIAKADSNSEATQAGTIKGKLSYLAPEYLEGLELDHRYDQFAVGITLWEMLCSRKLFSAKNDLAVLKQIQACKVPRPSSINPNVPAELDDIVLKALAKDRTQRFENMDKLNRALVKFLYSNYPDFNATDLSYFAKQLFKNEIAADKKKFVEFGKIDIKPYLKELDQQSSDQKNNSNHTGSFVTAQDRTGKIELDLGTFSVEEDPSTPNLDLDFTESTQVGLKAKKVKGSKTKTKTKVKSAAEKTGLVGRHGHFNKTSRSRVTAAGTVSRSRKGAVPPAKSGGRMLPTLVVASLLIFAILNQEKLSDLESLGSKQHASEINRGTAGHEGERNPASSYGSLVFGNYDPSMKIYLNGQIQKMDALTLELQVGKAYKLEVGKFGFKTWEYPNQIVVDKKDDVVKITIPELEKSKVGYLSSSENFPSGTRLRFKAQGQTIEKELPFSNFRVPAGTYEGTIRNELIGTEQKVLFTIEENKRNFLKPN